MAQPGLLILPPVPPHAAPHDAGCFLSRGALYPTDTSPPPPPPQSLILTKNKQPQARGQSAAGYLGVLQRGLVTGRPVEHPLRGVGVDVPEEELLHQAVQVVLQVLLLHADELQLVHGEVHSLGALAAVLFPPQVVGHVLHPGAPGGHEAGARAVHQLAEPLGDGLRVADDLHVVQLVVGLGAPADDPGGLAQAHLAPDDQGVGGAGAPVAAIIELVGLEGVVVVESVGPCDELWARPDFTAEGEKGKEGILKRKAMRSRFITVSRN